MTKVSKDGINFHEIVEDFDTNTGVDKSLAAAQAKGYKPYVDVSKDGQKVYTIEGSADSLQAAQTKGYKLAETFKSAQAAYDKEKSAQLDSSEGRSETRLRGIAQGLTWNLADEAQAGLRSLGSDKSYKELRDDYRHDDKLAAKVNPGNMLGAELATGLLSAGGAAKTGLSSAMKTGVLLGGANAVGASEKEDIIDIAKDGLRGAAIGAAIPLAIGGAVKGAQKGAELAKGVQKGAELAQVAKKKMSAYVSTAASGFKEGAKAAENLPVLSKIPLVGAVTELAGGARGSFKSLQNANVLQKELQGLKSVNSGKNLLHADDADLGMDLLNAGPSASKDWVASRAATVAPGQINSDQYRKILEMGTDRQLAATKFDSKLISKELADDFDTVAELLGNDRARTFADLHAKAAMEFDGNNGDKALSALQRARNSAAGLKSLVGGRTAAVLEDANEILTTGKAPDGYSVVEGAWDAAQGSERFHRLQLARQALDAELSHNKEAKNKFGEQILSSARDAFDSALKTAPSKRQADALYSSAKQIEAKLASATEFRNAAGRTEVDAVKVEKLLNNTDAARRFKDTQAEILEFIERDGIDESTKDAIQGVLARFKKHTDTADDRRLILAMRHTQGPSSPVIERQNQLINKAGLPPAAINSPAGYVNSVNDFVDTFGIRVFNKPWEALEVAQKTKIMKAFQWRQANPLALQSEEQKVFRAIFGGK